MCQCCRMREPLNAHANTWCLQWQIWTASIPSSSQEFFKLHSSFADISTWRWWITITRNARQFITSITLLVHDFITAEPPSGLVLISRSETLMQAWFNNKRGTSRNSVAYVLIFSSRSCKHRERVSHGSRYQISAISFWFPSDTK